MRKMFWSIALVCLIGISFSVGHLWCEKHHCGNSSKCPDKCLVKSCNCGDCKCCQDKALAKKCECSKDCTCGCVDGKRCKCCNCVYTDNLTISPNCTCGEKCECPKKK